MYTLLATTQIVTFLAAAVGATDVGQFLVSKRRQLGKNPGRAAGSVVMLLLWLSLFPLATNSPADIYVSGVLLVAGCILLFVHLKHAIATWRVYIPPAAAAVVLLASLFSR